MPAKDHTDTYSCEAGICHCVYVYVYALCMVDKDWERLSVLLHWAAECYGQNRKRGGEGG